MNIQKRIFKIHVETVDNSGGFTGIIKAIGSRLEAYPVIGSYEYETNGYDECFITSAGDISIEIKDGKYTKAITDSRFDIDDLIEQLQEKADHCELIQNARESMADRAYDDWKDSRMEGA